MAEAATQSEAGAGADRDRWLRKAAVDPADRVPVFAEAMAAVAVTWTNSFCSLASSEGEFAFKGLRAARVEELPLRREALPIFAALRVAAWEAVVGVSLDRSVVSTVVEALFGGGDEEEAAIDGRPVSPVEMRIVDVIGGQAATALTIGIGTVQPTRFDFDRTLLKPDAGFLGKPPTPLLAATFALTTIGRTVELDLVFPQAAIDAKAALWAGDAPAAPVLDAAGWARQLRSEVSRATMRVEAEMALRAMSLGALASMRVGQVLELPTGAGANVLLRCGDERLFRCHLGQSTGFYTVRLDEAVERDPQPSRKGR